MLHLEYRNVILCTYKFDLPHQDPNQQTFTQEKLRFIFQLSVILHQIPDTLNARFSFILRTFVEIHTAISPVLQS